jgi:hypothetical protein
VITHSSLTEVEHMARPAPRTNPKTGEDQEWQSSPDESREPDDERIARRAYERYEARGGQHGKDQEDWFAAEEEVRESQHRGAQRVAGDVDARRLEESASGIGSGSRSGAGRAPREGQ